jgi:hypothetical protein
MIVDELVLKHRETDDEIGYLWIDMVVSWLTAEGRKSGGVLTIAIIFTLHARFLRAA